MARETHDSLSAAAAVPRATGFLTADGPLEDGATAGIPRPGHACGRLEVQPRVAGCCGPVADHG
eukprot:9310843-Alexandrium_andersonii.AAC.1